MKNLFLPLAAVATLAATASAADLTLEIISPQYAPLSSRIEYLERYLGIQRNDWRLKVPTGYSATLRFRRKFSDKAILELTPSENSTSDLYLVTAPDPSDPGKIQITFGDQQMSSSVFMPKPESWQTKYGNVGGTKDNNLFEIWNSLDKDGPHFWCEVILQKKNGG